MKAYHFLKADMRAGEGDEAPWKVGETRTVAEPDRIKLCDYGYHFCPTLWDALQYAPISVPSSSGIGLKPLPNPRKIKAFQGGSEESFSQGFRLHENGLRLRRSPYVRAIITEFAGGAPGPDRRRCRHVFLVYHTAHLTDGTHHFIPFLITNGHSGELAGRYQIDKCHRHR